MEHITFSWIDYVLFGILMNGSILIGVYFAYSGRKLKTFADYFLGGKEMSVFPVSMSLIASCLSPISLLGYPTEIYLYGMQFSMLWISWIFIGLLTNYIFLPVFYKLQLTITYEYFELRFNKRVRKLASAMYVICAMAQCPTFLYGTSLAFNQVSGFNVHLTALLILSVCIVYTSIGGLKAVVWAHAFQLCCTLGSLGVVLIMGTTTVGGFTNVWQKAKLGERLEFFNLSPDPTIRTTFWGTVLGNTVMWTYISGVSPSSVQRYLSVPSLKGAKSLDPDPTIRTSFWGVVLGQTVMGTYLSGINPASVQRFLSVPTLSDAKRVLKLHTVISIITKFVCCFSGLILYAKYFDCDPLSTGQIKSADQIMPYYVLDVASTLPGLGGIFLSGLLSTALSTLSTSFNTVSGVVYKDFVSEFLPPTTTEANAQRIMKAITLIIGLISVAMVFVIEYLGTIVQIITSLSGSFSGPLVALFLLGMLFPMANSQGALWGTIISSLTMTIIIINNLVYIWNGSLRYPQKPLYTYGCNDTKIFNRQSISMKPEETPFWLFRISFLYYGVMGCVLNIVIGLLVSWFTRRKSKVSVPKDLFSPCIHRFLDNNGCSEEIEQEKEALNAKH